MPPKQGPSKKTTEKVKAKIVEDKTFGLKNKKGAKQQKFIQQVQKQVTNKNPRDLLLDPTLEREKKREEEKKKKEELTQLFKPVAQTVPKGVDPKSVVCAYYKQGICQKGDRCKFSHDLAVERKAEKRNIYEDTRDKETMENWDEEKLEDVVNQKHGDDNKKKNQTQIVCKYFIEAVENKTYGWFWSCPNGDTCMYRHALPPGFTLKSEMKKKSEEDEISMEILIEKERASLGTKVTRVTLETFLAWKARKILEKKDEIKKKEEKKRADYKLGFVNGLTGRDLFTFNPDLVGNDDDNAQNDIDYRHRADDDDEAEGAGYVAKELDAEYFASQAREVDDTGTVATSDRFSYMDSVLKREIEEKRINEQNRLDMACGGGVCESDVNVETLDNDDEDEDDEDGEESGEDEEKAKNNLKKSLLNDKSKATTSKNSTAQTNGNIEIDESLFNVDDLGEIQDELENLDI